MLSPTNLIYQSQLTIRNTFKKTHLTLIIRCPDGHLLPWVLVQGRWQLPTCARTHSLSYLWLINKHRDSEPRQKLLRQIAWLSVSGPVGIVNQGDPGLADSNRLWGRGELSAWCRSAWFSGINTPPVTAVSRSAGAKTYEDFLVYFTVVHFILTTMCPAGVHLILMW